MSNWSTTPTPRGGGGMFVKLNDGEHVDFVPLGDVRVKFQRWNQAERRYEIESGPGRGIQTQYVACVFDIEQKAQRILTLNAPTFDDMKTEIADAGGSVAHVFRLRRKGIGTNTRYTVKVLAQHDDLAAKIIESEGDGDLELRDSYDPAEVDWGDSVSDSSSSSDSSSLSSGGSADDDIPF